MTAIRNLLSMTALLGPALLATAAAAQQPPAARAPAAQAPPPPPAAQSQPWPAAQAQQPPAAQPQQWPGAQPQPWPPQGYASPGAAPPQVYYYPPQGVPPGPIYIALPRTLPYRENQDPPQGFRLETRMNSGLAVAGISVLGGAWAISALVAGTILSEGDREADGYAPLLIPVIGPFITLGTGEDTGLDSENDRLGGVLVLLNGATQLTGLALLVGGIASDQKIWVRSDIPAKTALQTPEIFVGPTGGSVRFRF